MARAFGEDDAPGVDDERVAVAGSFGVVDADLGGGNDKGLALDCPCAEEDVPMGFSCGDGKGGWDGEDIGVVGVDEGRVEFRETEIVTDRETTPAHRGVVGNHHLFSGGGGSRLAERHVLGGYLDVKEVDLVVEGVE